MSRRSGLGVGARSPRVSSRWLATPKLFGVLHALQSMGAVDVVILDGDQEQGEPIVEHGLDVRIKQVLDVVPKPNAGLLQRLRWTINPDSDYPNGCGVTAEGQQQLLSSVGAYDLVWFFKLRAPDLLPNRFWPHSVVDIDDVPSTCEYVNLQVYTSLAERAAAMRRLIAWRRREQRLDRRFSVLAVCSEDDRRYLQKIGITAPTHVIPNAFAAPSKEPVRTVATPPRVGFIGLLQHPPNREGIHWFVKNC